MTGLRRRDVLAGAAAIALAGPAPARPSSGCMAIGAQLSSVRDGMRRDPAATLRQLAGAGFQTVELAGLFGRSPVAMRQMLDAAGLRCPSMHVEPTGDDLALDGNLSAVADAAHILGATTVVMPIFLYPRGHPAPTGPDPMAMVRAAGRAMGAADYRRNAAFLNRVGARLRDDGLILAYHNHNAELRDLGGGTGLDLLVAATNPALVSFQIDLGWIAAAGIDPIALLRRYGDRVCSLHLKDVSVDAAANTDFDLRQVRFGEGRVDWPRTLAAAARQGVGAGYVEIEGLGAAEAIARMTEAEATLERAARSACALNTGSSRPSAPRVRSGRNRVR